VLESVQQIALALSLPLTQSCGEIVDALSTAQRDFESAKANLVPATEALNRLHHANMSDAEYNHLLASINTIPTLSTSAYDMAAIATHSQTYANSAEQARAQVQPIADKVSQLVDLVTHEIGLLFTDGWKTRATRASSSQIFTTMRQEMLTLQQQRDELALRFDVGNETKLSDIEAALAGMLRALNEAVQAVSREETASADIALLNATIERQRIHAGELLLRHMRLAAAATALNKLNSELSLESATAKSLESIGKEINEAFARIHSPNEYKYVGSDGVLLRSKESEEDWTLDKVSTGQRAAFALSVFLAVHRTAAKAPPVILIDDPVAHVDDLNALSFLDYLRDLAVSSKKQVFFATADARIASLFTRKFGFLGENFKRIDLVREVDAA
jgi:chromosome segregation protein